MLRFYFAESQRMRVHRVQQPFSTPVWRREATPQWHHETRQGGESELPGSDVLSEEDSVVLSHSQTTPCLCRVSPSHLFLSLSLTDFSLWDKDRCVSLLLYNAVSFSCSSQHHFTFSRSETWEESSHCPPGIFAFFFLCHTLLCVF